MQLYGRMLFIELSRELLGGSDSWLCVLKISAPFGRGCLHEFLGRAPCGPSCQLVAGMCGIVASWLTDGPDLCKLTGNGLEVSFK